jgi:Fic family protein
MRLQDIIKKMDLLRDELNALRPIQEDRVNRLNQKLRLDWNYHSNSIEGNTLTASETKAFILHGITANGKPFRDYIEMRGHNDALKKLEEIVHHELKITEKLITEFHKIILVEPFSGESEINPGKYKVQPNYLFSQTGERIDFAPPKEVPKLMNELINWLNNHIEPPKRDKRKYDLHPLLIASSFHVQFIQIHPFGDGNGRMARIMMNLILMSCGYVPAIIRLEKRKEYYAALNLSTMDNPKALAEFVGLECIHSLEMAIKAAKGESIDEDDDLDKKLALLKKEVDAEDEDKEIQTRLTADVVHNALKNWGYALLSELAHTTSKFNEFYDTTNHNIQLSLPESGQIIKFDKDPVFDTFETYFEQYNRNKTITHAEIKLHCVLGAYKKSGLNPFGCNYRLEIKFEEYHYEVLIGYFEEGEQEQKMKSFTKKLLHKPLSSNEMKEINKQWGETLFSHLNYYRNQQNGNDKI